MAFDPILGHMASGVSKRLADLPANPTVEELRAALAEVIAQLNNNNRDIVAADVVNFVVPPATLDIVLVIPHYLGYRPRATVFLNNVTITIDSNGIPTPYPGVDIPLPTYLTSFIPTGFGGSGTGLGIQFTSWIDFFVDEINLYVHLNNPLALSGSIPLSYELRREASN